MALSLANQYVVFSASTDVPKKLIPIQQMLTIDVQDTAALAGQPNVAAQHNIIVTPIHAYLPPIVVHFGSDNAAQTARDAAYAAVVAAATPV